MYQSQGHQARCCYYTELQWLLENPFCRKIQNLWAWDLKNTTKYEEQRNSRTDDKDEIEIWTMNAKRASETPKAKFRCSFFFTDFLYRLLLLGFFSMSSLSYFLFFPSIWHLNLNQNFYELSWRRTLLHQNWKGEKEICPWGNKE